MNNYNFLNAKKYGLVLLALILINCGYSRTFSKISTLDNKLIITESSDEGALLFNPINGIDLELSLVQEDANPSQWSNYTVVATITNEGPQTATGVVVDFQAPDGVVYVGADPFSVDGGSFDPFATQLWTIDAIPAGTSATLTVNYFLLAPEAPIAYAQVTSANEEDSDSSPGNGTPPSVNEDDEASTGGGMEVCEIEAALTAINCNDNGTPNNGADDTFTLDLTAEVTEGIACSPSFSYNGQSAAYGSVLEIGPFSTSGSLSFITVSDSEGGDSDNVSLVSNFGNCNNLEVICEDNILPNPGFELSFNSWNILANASSGGTSLAYQGISGISVQGGGPDDRCFYQTIDIQAGQSYDFSAYVNEGEGEGAPYFRYLDANGNVLSEPSLITSADGQWVRYESTSIAPSGAVAMEVGGRCTAQAQVRFDSYCVRPSSGQPDLADLVVENLNILNPAIPFTGNFDVVNYEVEIGNLGSSTTTGTFSSRVYFSTDKYLSADDVEGANFLLSFNANTNYPIAGTFQSFLPPSQLNVGQYYLILVLDEQNSVTESNENNNIIVGRFTLYGVDNGEGCGFLKTYDVDPSNNQKVFETDEGYVVEVSESGNTTTISTDFTGEQTGIQTGPSSNVSGPTISVSDFEAGEVGTFVVTRTMADGTEDFSKIIELDPGLGEVNGISISSSKEQPIGLNGYFIHGTVIIGFSRRPFFIKLNQAGDKVNQAIFDPVPNGDIVSFFDPHSDGNGGYYYQKFRSNHLSLVKVDQNGNLEWTKSLASDLPSTDVTAIETTIDGSAIYVAVTDNSIGRLSKFAADGTVIYADDFKDLLDPGGDFTIQRYVTKLIPTPDGGVVFGSRFFNTSSFPSLNAFGFSKLDANGNVVFNNSIDDESWTLQAGNITSDGGFLFVGSLLGFDNFGQFLPQQVALLKVTADGELAPECGDNNTGVLTVNCPVDKTITAPSGSGDFWQIDFDFPTASTTCSDGNVSIVQTAGPNNGSSVAIGFDYTVTFEITDNCGNVETCSFIVSINGGNNGGEIDLELSLSQSTENPSQWSNYSVVATLTNDGPETATGVVVDFQAPDGVVYVGADPFSIDGGSFDPFASQLWSINSIPAGTSVSLTVNYFLLSPEAPVAYAQVTSANEEDSDSSPGNGTPPVANEDDEASTDDETNIGFAVFNCPTDVSLVGLAANDYEASYNWTPPTATTDCAQGGLTITQIEGPAPGSNFTVSAGGTPVVYKITDACGNEQFCVFFVIVTPEPSQLICPENITVTATSASGAVVNYDEPMLSSYCDGTPTNNDLSSGLPSGSEFPIGTTTVFREVLLLGPAAFCQVNRSCTFDVTVISDNNDLPDLTALNLDIQNPSVESGSVMNYEIDLRNIGAGDANGNFNIKSFISSNNTLSADDIQDGIIPTGNWQAGFAEANVAGALTIPANLPVGDYYLIVKVDADEDITESNEGNNIAIQSFTVTEGETDPCSQINVTINPGSITLTNMNAPIRIQKIFTPTWSTAFECSGSNCDDVVTVDGLAGGSYFVQIQLFDASWNPICLFEDSFNVPGASGNNAFINPATPGLPVQLSSVRPNPTISGRVEVILHAELEKSQVLQVYNLLGGLEASYQLNLEKGVNIIPLDVRKLTGGTYYLQLVGQHSRQMPIRLMVLRD